MNDPVKRQRMPVHGVLLLDKPAGMSSTQALAKAKWLLHAEKAGHTGTLDPFATGLLPLCFGEATKFAQDLLDADKTYETTVQLGVTTTTGDTEGDVVAERPVDISLAQIEQVLAQFRGPIQQVPPMYSALKRDGRPLYEYARAGVTLERAARAVTIHALELIAFSPPALTLRVRCSKGTYIRVLGEDIGRALGCGAHLSALRRTATGDLSVAAACTLASIVNDTREALATRLLPVDALLSRFSCVTLASPLAERFVHGQRLALAREGVEPLPAPGRVRVLDSQGVLLGVADWQDSGTLVPVRLVAAGATRPG